MESIQIAQLTRKEMIGYCESEYKDHLVYLKLSARETDPGRKKILEQLSQQEEKHFLFWKEILDGYNPKPHRFLQIFILILRYVFGITFTVKYMERNEKRMIAIYRSIRLQFDGEAGTQLEEMIADEEKHEDYFIGQIDEGVVKYLGFIVLGLADAIIEITGVHAGFLGVTGSTTMAGVAGLIVGFAAAISMATAAYLQAKQDTERNSFTSAMITGFSYILAVVSLAFPYFLFGSMLVAFIASLIIAMLLTAYFTFFTAVIFERNFGKEFLESTLLTLGTALATYLFGNFLARIFDIQPFSF